MLQEKNKVILNNNSLQDCTPRPLVNHGLTIERREWSGVGAGVCTAAACYNKQFREEAKRNDNKHTTITIYSLQQAGRERERGLDRDIQTGWRALDFRRTHEARRSRLIAAGCCSCSCVASISSSVNSYHIKPPTSCVGPE